MKKEKSEKLFKTVVVIFLFYILLLIIGLYFYIGWLLK